MCGYTFERQTLDFSPVYVYSNAILQNVNTILHRLGKLSRLVAACPIWTRERTFMKQKFYALGAVVCFMMLLGTAGQADAFALNGRALVEQAALQVVGFCACIRGAGG